jgi:hypothetical protein
MLFSLINCLKHPWERTLAWLELGTLPWYKALYPSPPVFKEPGLFSDQGESQETTLTWAVIPISAEKTGSLFFISFISVLFFLLYFDPIV